MFAEEEEEEGPVLWEYVVGEGQEQPLYGPFSSAQMQEWAAQGYFAGGGARCRRVGEGRGAFRDCGRVDFGLYS